MSPDGDDLNTEHRHSFSGFKKQAGGRSLSNKKDLKPTDQHPPLTPEMLSQIDHSVAVSFGLDRMLDPEEKEDPDGTDSR